MSEKKIPKSSKRKSKSSKSSNKGNPKESIKSSANDPERLLKLTPSSKKGTERDKFDPPSLEIHGGWMFPNSSKKFLISEGDDGKYETILINENSFYRNSMIPLTAHCCCSSCCCHRCCCCCCRQRMFQCGCQYGQQMGFRMKQRSNRKDCSRKKNKQTRREKLSPTIGSSSGCSIVPTNANLASPASSRNFDVEFGGMKDEDLATVCVNDAEKEFQCAFRNPKKSSEWKGSEKSKSKRRQKKSSKDVRRRK